MYKKLKFAISLVLALIIFAGLFGASAYAPTDQPGSPDNPVQAGITKILRTPISTPIPPDMAFNFRIFPWELNGYAPGAPELEIPGNPGTFLTIPALGTNPVGSNDVRIYVDDNRMTTANHIDTRIMESGDLLAGVDWAAAGVYVWRIFEYHNTFPHILNTNPFMLESYVFSQADFLLTVHVFEGVNQNNEVVLYPRYAYGTRIRFDNGDECTGFSKVDPTPGDNNSQGDHSQIIFKNSYYRTNQQSTPDSMGPLHVSKFVGGNAGSVHNLFDFVITMNLDATLFPTPTTFTAFIYYEDRDEWNFLLGHGRVPGPRGGPHTITRGQPFEFQLRHSEHIVFQDVPIGTQFTVTETEVFGYRTYVGSNTGPPVMWEEHTYSGFVYGFLSWGPSIQNMETVVAFYNYNNLIPPTGVEFTDLPFIGMIALAFVGFIIFIIVAIRKRRNYYD